MREQEDAMRRLRLALVTAALLLSLSACSARMERALEETREHGAHFATWKHLGYSVARATPEETTRQDIAAARREHWWGEVVLVEPIQ
jgi:hypothetical protein